MSRLVAVILDPFSSLDVTQFAGGNVVEGMDRRCLQLSQDTGFVRLSRQGIVDLQKTLTEWLKRTA